VEILCSSLPQSADFIASYWSTEMTEIDEVKKENESLREKLQKYKQLEEDLMSQRIFEKARAQLSYWITAGGIVAIIATILGVGSHGRKPEVLSRLYEYDAPCKKLGFGGIGCRSSGRLRHGVSDKEETGQNSSCQLSIPLLLLKN